MFKLVKDTTSWWPVAWNGVAEDGSLVENRIEVQFVLVGRSEFKKMFLAQAAEDEDGDDRDRAVAARIMRNWRGIGDEDGKPLPFTPEFRDQWLDIPTVPAAVLAAYARLLMAAPEVREKNLNPSPAPGPAAAPAAGATPQPSRKASGNGERRKKTSRG